jgi:invasion protein IalB
MQTVYRRLLGVCVALALTCPLAWADESAADLASSSAGSAQPEWELVATHGDWLVVCLGDSPDAVGPPPCRMIQTLDIENESQRMRLLEIGIQLVDDGVPVIQMVFPQGVDLRPGIAMQVDDGEQFNAPFAVCAQGGCQVIANLGDDVVGQLRTGSVWRIGFRFFGNEQTVALEASLSGSNAAFSELGQRAAGGR